jgi:peptidoglycan/xylan/chitin deacetylase (PgdA/CDA1 family)
LRVAQARSTFFVLGIRAQEAPEIVDMTVAAGHEIACHSYSHRNAWRSTPRAAVQDVESGYDCLAAWMPSGGMYRPPYGKLTLPVLWALRRRGARVGWWTHRLGRYSRDAARSRQRGRAGAKGWRRRRSRP